MLLAFFTLWTNKTIRRVRGTVTGSVAALPASIRQHAQSTLPDGRVLLSGSGYWEGSTWVAGDSVYVYTPSRNEWEVVATMPASFNEHGQSTLNDGRVAVTKGSSTYIYTPDGNVWVSGATTPINFTYHRQSTLLDGRMLVSFGYGNVRTHIYTPNINVWDMVVALPVARDFPGQSVLSDGTVLASGGQNGTIYYNGVYIYSPDSTGTGKWISTATLAVGFSMHGQSTLFDGRALISGGYRGNALNTSYVYMPNSNTWVNAAPLVTGAYWHGQSTLTDGRVMISGGQPVGTNGNTAYIYTPEDTFVSFFAAKAQD